MVLEVNIESSIAFSFEKFAGLLGIDSIALAFSPDDDADIWGFYFVNQSTTLFTIEQYDGLCILAIDKLASYEDYRLFPYLADTLCIMLTGEKFLAEGKSAFETFNEEWAEYNIGEEIAYLKCLLSINCKYYFSQPLTDDYQYLAKGILKKVGVTLNSSTPRIYGYICYMQKHGMIPVDKMVDEPAGNQDDEINVEVPQHNSIGTVKSWQTDGSETTESYSKEDVDLLLELAENYVKGDARLEGVVLNDIGTIHEHGIGTPVNPDLAIRWFKEAIKRGDYLYAPTNLGDIFRKGLGHIEKDLTEATNYYMKSEDPYAWYRIGQSYEEGWTEAPNMGMAMEYYHKAAKAGHHLAIKRLTKG